MVVTFLICGTFAATVFTLCGVLGFPGWKWKFVNDHCKLSFLSPVPSFTPRSCAFHASTFHDIPQWRACSLAINLTNFFLWRKKLLWTILEEQFAVPRNTTASKIGNGIILLLWQLRCHCYPDHKNFSSLSNTAMAVVFPNLCWQWGSLYSNLGGIDPEKPYWATLINRDCLSLPLSHNQKCHRLVLI